DLAGEAVQLPFGRNLALGAAHPSASFTPHPQGLPASLQPAGLGFVAEVRAPFPGALGVQVLASGGDARRREGGPWCSIRSSSALAASRSASSARGSSAPVASFTFVVQAIARSFAARATSHQPSISEAPLPM